MAEAVLEKNVFDELREKDGHTKNFGRGWAGTGGIRQIKQIKSIIESIFTSTHNSDLVVTIPLCVDCQVSGRDNLQNTKVRDLSSKMGHSFFDFLAELRRSPGLRKAFVSLARHQYGLEASFDTIKLYSRESYSWSFPVEFTLICPEGDSEIEILSLGPAPFWVEPQTKRARVEANRGVRSIDHSRRKSQS